MKWISVKDEFPEPYEPVLLAFDGGDCRYDIGSYDPDWDDDDRFPSSWADSDSHKAFDCDPTHWMPLPALPGEAA